MFYKASGELTGPLGSKRSQQATKWHFSKVKWGWYSLTSPLRTGTTGHSATLGMAALGGKWSSFWRAQLPFTATSNCARWREWATRTFRKFTKLGLSSLEKTKEESNCCLQLSIKRNFREERGSLLLKVAVKGQAAEDPSYNNRHSSGMQRTRNFTMD